MDPDAKPGQEPVSITVDADLVGGPSTADLAEEQRQWHEERIKRRLNREYERAGKALSEVVSSNLDSPLHLNSIRIVGATGTRTGFLARVVAPYLASSSSSSSSASSSSSTPTSDTLRQVLQTTREVTDKLERLDIFSAVEAGLESSKGIYSTEEDVDLVIKVREASKYFIKTATDVGDGEGNATATARIRNALGGAETLEGSASFGTRTKSSFNVSLSAPITASPDTILSLSGFAIERDLSAFAACRERIRGAKLGLRTLLPHGTHEFAYDAIMRNLCEVGPNASMSVRNAAGLSVKSSLSHTFVRDTRDDPFIATKGSYLRLMQEYAGLGGDADHFKTEGETQLSRDIGAGCTLSFALRGGLLLPFGGKPSHMLDRFHLGGPASVRMFKLNNMGPRDNSDYIGGDLTWSSGLSLITPIPKRPDWPLKGHFFVNAGRLVGSEKDLSTSLASLFTQPAASVGCGLMYRHSIVRLEFNVGLPLAAHKSDGTRKGIQVGLGLHFL